MALPLKVEKNFVVGSNDPFFPDVQNQELRYTWDLFRAEHAADGTHSFLAKVETGTFAGSPSAQTVTLTDTTLLPTWVWLYSANDAYIYFAINTYSAGYAKRHDGLLRNYGITLTATGFTLAAGSTLNLSGVDYYYIAWGVGKMADPQGTNATPPTWVEHDEQILAGTGDPACRVEEDLYARFSVQHDSATGAHDLTAWPILKYEQASFIADGSTSQSVALNMADTPTMIWLLGRRPSPVGVYLSNFAKLRLLQAAALSETGFVTLAAGSFAVNCTKKTNESLALAIYSNTTDGSTVFADSSPFAWTLTTYVGFANPPTHSTDHVSTGSTSIKLYTATGLAAHVAYSGTAIPKGAGGDIFATRTYCVLSGDWRVVTKIWTATNLDLHFFYFDYYKPGDIHGTIFLRMLDTGKISVDYYEYLADYTRYYYQVTTSTTACNDSAWHDVELISLNGTLYLWIDGTQEGTPFTTFDSPILQLDYMALYIERLSALATDIVMYFDQLEVFATNKFFLTNDTIDYIALSIP